MSYSEKARALYDSTDNEELRKSLEFFFPELKESEDERIRRGLLRFLGDIADKLFALHGISKNNALAYLEKQKEQKPGDEDRYMEGYMNGMNDALKDKQPAEWSEEDERMLEVISYKISQHQGNDDRSLFTPDEAEFIDGMKDKLKSLRPQPHWKPSEEQMGALKNARYMMSQSGDYYDTTAIIDSLITNLQKLL